MTRFFLQLAFIGVGAILMEYFFLPYWGAAVSAFAVALIAAKRGSGAFFAGFLGIAFAWIGYTLFLLRDGGFILAERVAAVLTLPTTNLIFVAVALLGGILGGFSAWSGFLLRRVFVKQRR